jgi:CheY-like chemotaxis protein
MEQVLMNLLINAWQAMPGGGEICLETDSVMIDEKMAFPYNIRQGKYIKISITDTGTGMDEETRSRIFEPFFTTKEMDRGAGLGLATVYGIIKGHKGFINVYSEPGHGTTFTIYLPASVREIEEDKRPIEVIKKGEGTILLVDDEKAVLDVAKAMLESLGYKVYAAKNGQTAIDIFKERHQEIDIVIMDMIMPGLSGAETFDRLQGIKHDVKVVLSSGYSLNGEANKIMGKGCSGFLQKPFSLETLASKIKEIQD